MKKKSIVKEFLGKSLDEMTYGEFVDYLQSFSKKKSLLDMLWSRRYEIILIALHIALITLILIIK